MPNFAAYRSKIKFPWAPLFRSAILIFSLITILMWKYCVALMLYTLVMARISSGYSSLIILSLSRKALVVFKAFKSFDNSFLVLGNP